MSEHTQIEQVTRGMSPDFLESDTLRGMRGRLVSWSEVTFAGAVRRAPAHMADGGCASLDESLKLKHETCM